MPTYEYECQKCGHRFERFQSMKDEPLRECERCGGPVKRLIGMGAGFLFKGSGFYLTDYRSDSYRKKAKEESGGGEKKPEAKGEGKSESKPPATDKPAPPKPDRSGKESS